MEDSDILDIICEFCDDELVLGGDDIGIGACGSEDWFDKIKSENLRDSIVTNPTQIKNEINNNSITRTSEMMSNDDLYRPAMFQWDNNHDDLEDDDDEFDDDADSAKDKKRKRARQPNPDAELIADATEKNLKMLNLDPNSKEGKRQRRKIRNRMSAQIHRERKKAYIETLEGMVHERNEKIVRLQNDMRMIVLENEKLRGQLNMLAPNNEIFNDQLPHHSPMSDGFNTSTTISTNSGIISDSEESFNSVRSSDNSPVINRGYTSLNTGLSLFSVMMMLGITLFSGPIHSPGLYQSYSNSMSDENTFSQQSLNSLSMLQLGTSSYFPHLESHLNAPLGSGSVGGGGRILLSTTETDDDNSDNKSLVSNYIDNYPTSLYLSSLPSLPLLPSLPTTYSHDKHHSIQSSALWKYQDHVAQLFPLLDRNHTTDTLSQSSSSASTTTSSTSTRSKLINKKIVRHLRSGAIDSSRTSSAEEATALVVARPTMESNPSVSQWNNNNPTIKQSTTTSSSSSQFSDQSSYDRAGISHVLMTRGRALLDHSLLTFPDSSDRKHQIISTTSTTSNPLTPITIPLMSTTTTATSSMTSEQIPSELTEKAISTWNGKYNNNYNHHTTTTTTTTTDHTGNTNPIRPIIKIESPSPLTPTSPPPVLVMLLPASSIRWGSNWQNSSDHPFHSYTKDDDSNRYASPRMNGDHEEEGEGYDHSSLWVEIKCSVYSAELVRNVTLY